MENCICKADIRANKKAVFWLVLLTLLIAIISLIPVNVHDGMFNSRDASTIVSNISGDIVYIYYDGQLSIDYFMLAISLIPAIILALISVFCWLYIKSAENCFIELNDKCVKGVRKTIFNKRDLNLPIEQIDSIMISHSFKDTIFGGDTLLIRSASGVIKFPWVRNAKEFSDTVLAKIEEYKNKKGENKNLDSDTLVKEESQSAAHKIKELKELFEIGAISQEEFDAKRKELLDKI